MKKRGRNLAALAAMLAMGAGAMGRRGTDLGEPSEGARSLSGEQLRRAMMEDPATSTRQVTPEEMRDARRRVLEKEMPGAILSGDAYPVTSESGMPIRSGQYKKGGAVKTYAKGGVTRADGCARKGHTKGRYI